ncbi:MAG: hypothetical protein D6698_04185, partial [Gammaproteobacteria bacterium]
MGDTKYLDVFVDRSHWDPVVVYKKRLPGGHVIKKHKVHKFEYSCYVQRTALEYLESALLFPRDDCKVLRIEETERSALTGEADLVKLVFRSRKDMANFVKDCEVKTFEADISPEWKLLEAEYQDVDDSIPLNYTLFDLEVYKDADKD